MDGCLILIPERQNAMERALPREVELLKMNEQSGNVYENKGALWESLWRTGNVDENKATYPLYPGMLLKRKVVSLSCKKV